MKRKHRFEGIIVPMVTPVRENGALDEDAAARITSQLAANELGVFVLGTTGEGPSTTHALRRQLVEIAVSHARDKVPVFAGIADTCAGAAIAAADEYLRLGVDAVVAPPPAYFPLGPADLESWFRMLAREIAGPLLLYNIPVTTHHSLPVDVVARLSEVPNIVGFKDSESTAGRAEKVAARLRGRDDFALFIGVAADTVRALRLGFVGSVPSSGNLIPNLWRDLYAAAVAGDWTHAERLQREVDAIAALYQGKRPLGAAIAALKLAMSEEGLCAPHMLPPLRELPPADRDEIRARLQAYAAQAPDGKG